MNELDAQRVIGRIRDNDTLLDILIQCEDLLDSLDLYAFANWIDGEVVAGPDVRRYWVEFTLKFPYSQMPDPTGGVRLLNHDIKVSYRKSEELVPRQIVEPSDLEDGQGRKPKLDREPIWLVSLQVPRRFIDDIADEVIDQYADMVDAEDIAAAEDEGLAAEPAIEDEGLGELGGAPGELEAGGPPPGGLPG